MMGAWVEPSAVRGESGHADSPLSPPRMGSG